MISFETIIEILLDDFLLKYLFRIWIKQIPCSFFNLESKECHRMAIWVEEYIWVRAEKETQSSILHKILPQKDFCHFLVSGTINITKFKVTLRQKGEQFLHDFHMVQCVARRAPMQQCVWWLVRAPTSS